MEKKIDQIRISSDKWDFLSEILALEGESGDIETQAKIWDAMADIEFWNKPWAAVHIMGGKPISVKLFRSKEIAEEYFSKVDETLSEHFFVKVEYIEQDNNGE